MNIKSNKYEKSLKENEKKFRYHLSSEIGISEIDIDNFINKYKSLKEYIRSAKSEQVTCGKGRSEHLAEFMADIYKEIDDLFESIELIEALNHHLNPLTT